MALTESDIAQVLEAVKAESKSVESLETVGSLSGVKSLPGQKGDKLVNVPITLLSKPADDAAARAIALPKGWRNWPRKWKRPPGRQRSHSDGGRIGGKGGGGREEGRGCDSPRLQT